MRPSQHVDLPVHVRDLLDPGAVLVGAAPEVGVPRQLVPALLQGAQERGVRLQEPLICPAHLADLVIRAEKPREHGALAAAVRHAVHQLLHRRQAVGGPPPGEAPSGDVVEQAGAIGIHVAADHDIDGAHRGARYHRLSRSESKKSTRICPVTPAASTTG